MKTPSLTTLLFIASLLTSVFASESCDKATTTCCPELKAPVASTGTVQTDLGTAHTNSLPTFSAAPAPTPAKVPAAQRPAPKRAAKPALPAHLFM